MEELEEAPAIEEAVTWRSWPHQAAVRLGHGGWSGRRGGGASA
jgi:hypothetical protein